MFAICLFGGSFLVIKVKKLKVEKMKKSFTHVASIVLAVIIFASVGPLAASAATTGTCGDNLTWKFNRSKGALTISGTGEMYNYEYDKVPWFEYLEDVKKIVINDGVTSIGDNAFSSCVNATSATIPDGVKTIGDWAFCYCNKITSIKIPDSVTSVGKGVFSYCWALSDVTISENLTEIVYYMFFACNSLESVTIPDSVTTIGDSAFCCCDNLTNIVIPDNVTTIANNAFASCVSLESIVIPDTVTIIGQGAFDASTSLADVYYTGTKKQWKAITIGAQNEQLYGAKIHYNYHIHKYTTVETKATLSQSGKIVEKCTGCGDVSKSTTIYRPTSFKLSTTEYTYNKTERKPKVTVKDSKGNTLKEGTDYTVKYESGRKLPGKYTVTITFKGKYSGTKKLAFTVAPKVTSEITATQTITTITLKWNKVTGADGYRVYKYNSKTKSYEKFKDVTGTSLKLTKLKAGTTYKFKVRAYTKDDGTIFGKSSSEFATATKTKTPSITSLTSSTKGKAVIKWSNVSGETGYQVYYSTSKNGTYKKVASYEANKTAGSKSNLTSQKTYYFKVRAYKKTASGTVYSSWSSVNSVKVK